ncbi:FCD domain-containing protein [Vibrio astriarenae]|jgi:GntR family uxuAB operon transcriptional repressor|uniref:FCD domain-containing protein n=2 Tax=Vibrio agarivorans TaxID=153622 RepID=A0ABT7Y4L0_9VIBR|nr:FCD domain-containing protein [Vibrio agarivorans]MDN2482977.1 FCD domain-containing protein [Vibrio agarivorans]
MQKTTKRRYYDIGLQIEELLYSGVFKAGERLPSERELSERFETSRATIREAIIMLELKGLVVVRQGAGIYFIDSPEKITSRTIVPHNDVGPFELLQARQIIESNIAGFAATQIKINELRDLKRVLQEQEKELDGDSERFEELDRQFHTLIAESTQNRVLINQASEMWRSVRTQNPLWKALNDKYLHEIALKTTWLEDHKKIFMALQKRNPEEAKQAVWDHIENSKQELLKIASSDNIEADLDDYFFAMDLEI